ncbi:MAG: CoA-binding protein [Pseudomonadota bacterium]
MKQDQMPDPREHHVVVLGASPKPDRYSNQAVRLLSDHGYQVTPVNPRGGTIEGLAAAHNLGVVAHPVHTLSLYVGPSRLEPIVDELLKLDPGRVIFNPGSESAFVQHKLTEAGTEWLEGCTLVMLKTGTF